MDLIRLDRDIALCAGASELALDWEDFRHVSGQRALRELDKESATELRDALASWVLWLTVARVSQPAARAFAEARSTTRAVVHLRKDVQMTEPEIVRGLLGAQNPGEAQAYFAAWPELAPVLAPLLGRVREMRTEALHRLGIDDVGARFLGIAIGEMRDAAERFLVATRDLAEAAVPSGDVWPLDLHARLARGATEGWPARLTWRTVLELVPGLSLRASLPEPPRAVGGVSFARALAMLGRAFRRASTPESSPFVLREPPLFVMGHRAACVLAAVAQEPAFHTRSLGLGAGRAKDQARTLRLALFLHARLVALRVALSRPGADAESLSELALGHRFPAKLALAWPRFREDDLAELVAMGSALELYDQIREREGDDWFRNPRAFGTLRDLSLIPAASKGLDLTPLAKRFEETLA